METIISSYLLIFILCSSFSSSHICYPFLSSLLYYYYFFHFSILHPNIVVDIFRSFSDYGTMLEIRDIQYFPDGRSVVDTMGGRRFKVINRGMKDGYDVASVEFLKDCPVEESELAELQSLHDRTKMAAQSWFNAHDADMKTGILSHYGSMPAVEEHYWSLPSGPAWAWWVLAILPLDSQAQQQILCHVHLKKRLEAIGRIIAFLVRRNSNV